MVLLSLAESAAQIKVGGREIVPNGLIAGFLPWNFPSASIFMGDVGSATLGLLLASLVVRHVAVTDGSFIRAVLPMMPFILDTSCHSCPPDKE